MRVQIGVSSLISEHNPHYGSGKNTNAREAVHVIDGLLEHETDLCINEHYTDTAGYTDQVFGPVSYTHLTLPTNVVGCRSRWSPYH